MLNATKETVFTVSYRELERFIKEESGHEYDVVSGEECSNDTTITVKVDSDQKYYDRNTYEKHKAGKYPSYALRDILCCLCEDGKLEPGKYLVRISW